MPYHVETRTPHRETFLRIGPTCTNLATACELLDTLITDPTVAGIRIRDMSRNPDCEDQVIILMDNLRGDQ